MTTPSFAAMVAEMTRQMRERWPGSRVELAQVKHEKWARARTARVNVRRKTYTVPSSMPYADPDTGALVARVLVFAVKAA